jgi:hypothetical protein
MDNENIAVRQMPLMSKAKDLLLLDGYYKELSGNAKLNWYNDTSRLDMADYQARLFQILSWYI